MNRLGISIAASCAAATIAGGLASPTLASAAQHDRTAHRVSHKAHGPRQHKAHGSKQHKAHGSKQEHKLSASITIKLTPPSPKLPQTNQINLFVPKGFKDAGAKLPQCSPVALENKGPHGCPKDTIVGGGNSIGYTILGGEYVIEHLTLTMVNGPHGALMTWVEGRTPVQIEQLVTGVITAPSGFGEEMAFTIPHSLLEPLTGAPGWLQTLNAHLSGKAGWLRTTSCPAHPWKLKAELGYTNGEGISVETELACVS